jgi:oxygen-independent coproporphyrinogen III oxidase
MHTSEAPGGTTGVKLPESTEVGNYFVSNYPPYSQWKSEVLPQYEAQLHRPAAAGELGLYVHVPFCRQRCSYCYFRVYPRAPAANMDRYISALLAEADLYRQLPIVKGRRIANVYFGGGTPTLLSMPQIRQLLGGLRERLDMSSADEITYECQPGTVTRECLSLLREHGVTRASIGIQTLNDKVLRQVGRAAGADDCREVFDLAQDAGFDQINVDLLAGLPGETEESWLQTIKQITEMAPDTITIYQLELTHNSAMYRALQSGGGQRLPTWPEKRAWVRKAFLLLEQNDYVIYGAYWAVKDTSKPRFAYVRDHYWRGDDLLALGETSFGTMQGFHYQNVDNFEAYAANCESGKLPLRRAYQMSSDDQLRREFILLLKTGNVDIARLDQKFSSDTIRLLNEPLQILRTEGLLTFDAQRVELTREGLLCVDWLLPMFYAPQYRAVRYT